MKMESPRDHGRGSKHEALASSGQSCLIHRGSPNLPGGMGTPQDRVYIPYLSENRFLSLSTKS